jgi:hypothetical protein
MESERMRGAGLSLIESLEPSNSFATLDDDSTGLPSFELLDPKELLLDLPELLPAELLEAADFAELLDVADFAELLDVAFFAELLDVFFAELLDIAFFTELLDFSLSGTFKINFQIDFFPLSETTTT